MLGQDIGLNASGVRDAVLARSPLVIALTDRQVGRRLTVDRQAGQGRQNSGTVLIRDRNPNRLEGKRSVDGSVLGGQPKKHTPRQKHTTQLAIEYLARQRPGRARENQQKLRRSIGGQVARSSGVVSFLVVSKAKWGGIGAGTDLDPLQPRRRRGSLPCLCFAAADESGERAPPPQPRLSIESSLRAASALLACQVCRHGWKMMAPKRQTRQGHRGHFRCFPTSSPALPRTSSQLQPSRASGQPAVGVVIPS